MSRYIDADKVKEYILSTGFYCDTEADRKYSAELIDGLFPTADVAEARHGRWIWKGEEGDSRFMCSVCHCKENVPTCNGDPTIWDYCPNCGARMVNEDDDTD